jgi:hypothetical protein
MDNNEKSRKTFSGNPFLEWLLVSACYTMALFAVKDHDALGYISAFLYLLCGQIVSGTALSIYVREKVDHLKNMIKEGRNNENV